MELLIQVSTDPERPGIHPPGDVIWYAPDGHEHWGLDEIKHPHWRIVRVEGLTQAEVESLVGSEVPTKPNQKKLHLRGMTVDVAKLNLANIHRDAARRRATHAVEAVFSRKDFMACVALKIPAG